MRLLTALHLAVAMAGCYDTRALDGHPALHDSSDAATPGDAAPAGDDGGWSSSPDGAASAPTNDACPAGTPCGTAPDACHAAPLCDGAGHCGAPAARPDGTAADPAQPLLRCCQGAPTRIDSPENCGACGLGCNGHDCLQTHGGQYYCGCWLDADCWSGCCTHAYGVPWVCAAASCDSGQPIACPGNATNSDGDPNGPNYCHY